MSSLIKHLARPIPEILVIYGPLLVHTINLAPILIRIASPHSPILLTSFMYESNFQLYYFLPLYSVLAILDFFASSSVAYAAPFVLFFFIQIQEKLQHVIDSLRQR